MRYRVAIAIALSSIIASTYANVAKASSNEQFCRDVIKQKLKEADFGSEAANAPLVRKTIVLVAQKDVMNIIKLSNRGELNSFDDRQKEIGDRIEQKQFFNLVEDTDAVSYRVADEIEPLLENECQGVR